MSERKRAEQALHQSEEMFRTLADTTPAAIFILQGTKASYVNAATEELLGYTQEELLSMNFWDVIHADSQELIRLRGLARQRGEDVPTRYEVMAVTKDGEERWLDVSAAAFEFGGEPATLGTAFDITERKRAEEARQQARDELEGHVEHQLVRRNPYRLTFRELTVLHLIARGLADKEIAGELGISPFTVHKHVANILSKMNAASRTEAGVRAQREGLLD